MPIEEKNGKKVITFGKKKDAPKSAPTVAPDTGKAIRMIKVIEERISNLDRKTELIENNILSVNKRQNVELKTVNSKLMELEKDIGLVKRRIVEMATDLKNFARREEFDTIKKYIDLWQPLSFVSREELDSLIEEKLRSMRE